MYSQILGVSNMRKAITLLLALVMTASIAYADFFPASNVPNLITYQGKLLTALGLPVTNNAQSITFRIMDADVAGTQLWVETQTVNVVNGLYTVVLGSGTALPEDLTAHAALYLEVVIDGTPLAPRTRLHSVPYALMAQTIDSKGALEGQYLQWSNGFIEDGIPAGWYPATLATDLQSAYVNNNNIELGENQLTLSPANGDLEITGTAKLIVSSPFQVLSEDPLYLPAAGKVLTSDAQGNAHWQTIATDLQTSYEHNLVEGANKITTDLATHKALEIAGDAGLIVSSPLKITSTDPLYLPAAGKVLTSDADGNAHWQAISSVVGWNYDAVNDYLYTNMGRVGIGVNDPSAKLEVRYDDNSYNAVDIETSGDAYALRVASTGSTMNALDVIGNLSVAGYSILENATTDDIPALSVLTNNASAIYMQNNSFNYPALDVSNASPYQALAVTGTAAGVALVDLSNNGDGTTLKISNDNPDGSSLEVYGAKSSFGSEVLHNVNGTETAISVYADAYALNMLTGHIKFSSASFTVTGNIDLEDEDYKKLSSIILTGNPGAPFSVQLPTVTAEDAGKIIIISNGTGSASAILNGAGASQIAFPAGSTLTLICIGADLWSSIGSGHVLPYLP